MPRLHEVYRISNIQNCEELSALLTDFYPGFLVVVKRVQIPQIPPPAKKQKLARQVFEAAFKKNQSLHHGYLKWFGYNWLSKRHFGMPEFYRYEARILIPSDLEVLLSKTCGLKGVKAGRVLPVGWNYPVFDSSIKIVDVWGDNATVECGITDPSSLVLPIAAKVVKRTVWIPYPHKSIHTDWPEYEHFCDAFLIHRPQPQHLRKPVQTIKAGQLTPE